MRRSITLLAALLLAASTLLAQHIDPTAARYLREDNTRAANNINSYEATPSPETPAPAGFRPFYVSHYGRHGSRSTWGEPVYTKLIETLASARNVGILTPQGDSLMHEIQRVKDFHDGMDGRLTQRGVREHREIAERLYARYPGVFDGAVKVRAIGSTSQRCLISMNSFTVALGQKNPQMRFYLDTGDKFMGYISNTSEANRLTAGTEALLHDWMEGWQVDTVTLLRNLFSNQKAARILVPNVEEFQENIISTAEVAEDFDIPENLYRYLPFDAIYRKWSRQNHYLYMHHCNSVEFGRERMPLAQSAIDDFIAKADEAIAGGEYAADLRFGHDYPLMAIASYLGIEGVGDRLRFDEVDAHWYGWQNICMGSNLQLVFYRNDAGEVLVKFLYNERESRLRGLKPYSGPYYRWEDFKADPAGYLR